MSSNNSTTQRRKKERKFQTMENLVDVVSDICKGGLRLDVLTLDTVATHGAISDAVEIRGSDELRVAPKLD